MATLVTPNLREASILTGREILNRDSMREAAWALVGLGARAALVKSGSAAFTAGVQDQDAIDIFYDGHNFREFRSSRSLLGGVHGSGLHAFRRHCGVARAAENLWKMRLTQGNGT